MGPGNRRRCPRHRRTCHPRSPFRHRSCRRRAAPDPAARTAGPPDPAARSTDTPAAVPAAHSAAVSAARSAAVPTADPALSPSAIDGQPLARPRSAGYGENIDFIVNGRRSTADGTGQTIAIVISGLDPNIGGDLEAFDRRYGIPDPPSFRSVYFQGAQNNESSDGIMEISLDVESAHAIAPGAKSCSSRPHR